MQIDGKLINKSFKVRIIILQIVEGILIRNLR